MASLTNRNKKKLDAIRTCQLHIRRHKQTIRADVKKLLAVVMLATENYSVYI